MPEAKLPEDSADNATIDPEQTVEGQSFYNPALTGSGTIVDGEYRPPEPGPMPVLGLGPDRTSGGRPLQHLGGLRRGADKDANKDEGADAEQAGDENRSGRRGRTAGGK
jgi:hypothetical protein